MKCKDCKHGKYRNSTGTVYCRIMNKELLFDRADKCEEYGDSTLIKNLKAKNKYKG